MGANNNPKSLTQFKRWINKLLPGGGTIHTFGLAAICWATWKRRKRACFDNKMITNPVEILIQACAFMTYWTGLYNAEFQEKLLDGVKVLLSCAHRVLAQQGTKTSLLQLPAPSGDNEDDDGDED